QPSAWVILSQDGNPLPPLREGEGRKKILTTPGSHGGLMNAFALERISTAEVIWKVEGVTDMLALQSSIPHELRDLHIVLTNSGGCSESPKDAWAELLKGKRICVSHDADRPGQTGAAKWVRSLAGVASKVVNVQLPYDVAPNHGKDLRDYFNAGNTYE